MFQSVNDATSNRSDVRSLLAPQHIYIGKLHIYILYISVVDYIARVGNKLASITSNIVEDIIFVISTGFVVEYRELIIIIKRLNLCDCGDLSMFNCSSTALTKKSIRGFYGDIKC